MFSNEDVYKNNNKEDKLTEKLFLLENVYWPYAVLVYSH